MTTNEQGQLLLRIARAAIAERFGEGSAPIPHADWLDEPGATFVTLMEHGQLRGCIGSLEAHRPLLEDVRHNAVAAAFHDPRFPPLAADELDEIRVEVSLLSPARPLTFHDEADALKQLRPHVDGVIFQCFPSDAGATESLTCAQGGVPVPAPKPYTGPLGRNYRSTFLPQVWEQLPAPREFMAHLKRKAGLPMDFWSPDVRLSCYSVEKWKE